MRVHELAKKYEKTNKEFLDLIKLWGIEGKSHLSGLTEEEVAIVLDKMEGKKSSPKKSENTTETKSNEEKVEKIIKKENKDIKKLKKIRIKLKN